MLLLVSEQGKGKMTTYWLNGEKPDLSVIASVAPNSGTALTPASPTLVPTTGFFASSDLKRISSKPRSLASVASQPSFVPLYPVAYVEQDEVIFNFIILINLIYRLNSVNLLLLRCRCRRHRHEVLSWTVPTVRRRQTRHLAFRSCYPTAFP